MKKHVLITAISVSKRYSYTKMRERGNKLFPLEKMVSTYLHNNNIAYKRPIKSSSSCKSFARFLQHGQEMHQ